MKKYQQGLLLLALLPGLGLTSCSDDNPWSGSDDMGGIALNLESDARLMRHSTRADDTNCPIVPDANAFGIRLSKSDKSYDKEWSSLEGFNKEEGFPIGDYTIEAVYGDMNVQGFERPCFKGNNSLHVSPGTTTTVNVTATLANAMVTMRYTDEFLAAFSSYSAAIQTPNHASDLVVFPQGESRPAFIDPSGEGDTELIMTLPDGQGGSIQVRPAKFKAESRKNYLITVNVTGDIHKGDAALTVTFEENVTAETITISLGDELFTSPAPEVRATNFTVGTPIELMQYDELSVSPQFDLYAFGGFQEVNLKVSSTSNASYAPAFGNSVNLLNADAATQGLLANEGVRVHGLFRNPDKMAVVNVKDFLGNLPEGEYNIRVEVVDALGRLSTQTVENAVVLTAKVTETKYTLASAGSIDYMAKEVKVTVNTNSVQLKNRIKFTVNNAEVSYTVAVGTPSGELPYAYTYTLSVPEATKATVPVKSAYGRKMAETAVAVNGPVYETLVDAFARFAVFKIATENAEMKEFLTSNLSVYNGNTTVTPANISRDVTNGLITVKGLNAATTHSGYTLKLNDSFEKPVPSFVTEAEADVPNGDFSENGDHIYFSNIHTGGTFGTSLATYQWRTTIDRYAPAGWATLNAKTAYPGSNPLNTWFVEPSTYLDNGVCVVRTVGYHHNGTLPERDEGGFKTYSGKYPQNLEISEGVLFLGSYSFDGTAHRENGVPFSSRPMSMTFDYKYSPKDGHQAQADLIVLDNDNNVIASKTEYLSASPDMQTRTLRISNYPFGKKASKLYVRFRSMRDDTEPALNVPGGSSLNISGHNGINNNIPANEYKAYAVGSVLTLDNVKLGYTEAVAVTAAPRRK